MTGIESRDPTRPPRRSAAAARWNGRRVSALVGGIVLAVASLALIGAGGFAVWTANDNGGYVPLGTDRSSYHAQGYALTTDGWNTKQAMFGLIDRVRVQVTPQHGGAPVFVGIAAPDAVRGYLADVEHTTVHDTRPGATFTTYPGGAPATPPATAGLWVTTASGTGAQTLDWPVRPGNWALVVMNADGSRSVSGRVSVAAAMPALFGIGIGFLAAGVVVLAGGVALVVGSVRRATGRRGTRS